METALENYRGIHPGMILARELKKRNLKKRPFALSLQIYPQTINDITKGKRSIPTALSLKIDKALGLEEGTMHLLQAYFEIEKEKHKQQDHPDLSVIRKILFWDTDFDQINWKDQYKSIIERVFERGNNEEKQEILNFYGKEKVKFITGSDKIAGNSLPVMRNIKTK
ncbi:plasmid maintenance system antidote protein [Pedobacter panaciterrae]|uniref:helix-turn-helix transcriptional regulator n=1 Tax=Pedobacter panaciterrae TaxID=363849 RepID=UPI00155DD8B1|nr:plasmid maintenance system antidote protein [Pedobacter panaciterrae]NQX54026.1 plasmid maintenance system antidote protein [Pedobacter panaciterrae]